MICAVEAEKDANNVFMDAETELDNYAKRYHRGQTFVSDRFTTCVIEVRLAFQSHFR